MGIDPTTWEELATYTNGEKLAPPGCNTLRKPASPMQLRSAADGKVLQISPSLQPSPQIQDPSHVTTAVGQFTARFGLIVGHTKIYRN